MDNSEITTIEQLDNYLKEKFKNDIEKDIGVIVSHIKEQGKKVSIKMIDFDGGLDGVDVILGDKSMPKSYELLEDGVSLLYFPKDLLALLFKYINDSVEELSIPLGLLEYDSLFPEIQNIKVLNLDEVYSFQGLYEHLEEIAEKTNVTTINLEDSVCGGIVDESYDAAILNEDYNFIMGDYKGITIKSTYNSFSEDNDDIFYSFHAKRYDQLALLEPMLQNIDIRHAGKLEIDCEELSKIKRCNSWNDHNIIIKYTNGMISEVHINISDYSILEKLVTILDKRISKDTKIILDVENESNKDFLRISKLLKKYNIEINYDDYDNQTDIDGFIGMRATLDYYTGIVNENNLSPYEKLIYAYDLIKSFYYKENKNNLDESRNIPDIVRRGYIVCVGYARFLKQLLKELGINSVCEGLGLYDSEGEHGHERNFVYIKDEKYGIDGVYSLDATYDSRSDNLSLVLDKNNKECIAKKPKDSDIIIKKYDSTANFSNFFIPFSRYERFYTSPGFSVCEYVPLLLREIDLLDEFDRDELLEQFRILFGEGHSFDECINIIRQTPEVSNDKFREALSVVKRCQGYDENECKDLVNQALEIIDVKNNYINSIAGNSKAENHI